MNTLKAVLGLSTLLLSSALQATVTINLELGELTNSSSVALPGGTLWALISEDSSGNLPGGLLTDDSLYNNSNSSTILSHFGGATISAGATIGGGYVVAIGSSAASPAGDIAASIVSFDFVAAGLSTGDKLGVYWFPGRTTASNTLPATNFEIGGFHRTAANIDSGGNSGLIMPTDGAPSATMAFFDNNITAGTSGIAPTEFQAITVVPEPSTILLIGAVLFVMIRRRR